jgi:gliding motility-associated-like protein
MITKIDRFLRASLLFVGFLFLNLPSWAQFDTQFWLPPLWDDGQANHTIPSELFIATPYPFDVNVHIETPDGITFVYDVVVSSGNPLSITLTPSIGMTNVPNTLEVNKGLIITSDAAIQCVHKISAEFNQTLVTLKGRNGRGTDFWCGSQVRNMNANYSPNEYHYISVMAMEDNTTITLNTPFGMFLSGPGDLPNPHVITLDRHETYLIRGNNPIQHVAGAHVTSDKEIVVVSGSTHTRIAGGNAADGGTDQLVPISLIGTEFILVKGDNAGIFDYGIVVATENSTAIYLDGSGSPAATINAGQFYDFTIPGSSGSGHSVVTSKPAYVYHFTGASQDDEVDMSAIPQIECTGSRYIEFSRFTVNTVNQVMNVIAPPEAISTLTFNGVFYEDVPGAVYGGVPGFPGWLVVAFPNSSLEDNNILTSEGFFHAGFLTGNGGSTGCYGFLSGFNDAFEFLDPITGLPATIYNAGTLCQGDAIDHCLQVFSCGADHNIIDFEGNDGIITITPVTEPFDTCFNYIAPFNLVGNDTITFTVSNEFGFEGNVDIVFTIIDPDTPIDAGPIQQLCSPDNASTLSAINPDPLVNGFWTVLQGGATLANPNSPTTSVTNLALGTNTFLWTQDYGCEVNTDITQIIVFNGAAPNANAGPDALICSNQNSYVMQANSPGVSAIGTWEIVQGTATINNINNPTATVTNLGIGVNIFEWNIDNGPCPGGATVDQMTITVYNQNAPAANAGPDQQFCSSNFVSATLAANNATFPGTGQWSVISGSGTFTNAASPTSSVSGLSLGQNIFQWTINNGPCGTTTDTVIITIFDANTPLANAGSDAQYCSNINSHIMTATAAVAPATGSWTLISGSGVVANPSSPTSSVSNLGIGTNTFRWTINNGPCPGSNFDEVTITIYNQNQAPANAGADQSFCSDTFVSAPLSANAASSPATGSWTLISGSGSFANANSPNTSVSGLALGQNIFQWNINNGPCGNTSDQVIITLFNAAITSTDAGPSVEYCSTTTSHTMAASPVASPAVGVWTLISGGGVIQNPNSPSSLITNLPVGVNVFEWTINNGPCGNDVSDLVTITIYNQNQAAANAGVDQAFCSDIFVNTQLDANTAVAPASGMWSVVAGSGIFSDPSDPDALVSGLSLGENVFQWTIDNGPCPGSGSSDTVSITIFDENQAPVAAGDDVSFCTPVSTYVMDASAVNPPGEGVWTLISGSGTISDVNNPNASISGLGGGANTFRWSVDNGPCGIAGFDEMTIFIFDANQPSANAGPDQEFCWSPAIPIVAQMNANDPIFPATGMWTLVQGSGNITDADNPETTIVGLGIGINIFEWTISNGPCGAPTSDQVIIYVFAPNQQAADAGEDQEVCSDTNSAVLDANSPIVPAIGSWLVIEGSGVFSDVNDPNATVSGMTVGINTFRWTINNGPCLPNQTSDTVTILLFDSTAPISNAGPDQSICSNVASVQMDASASVFPGQGTWSVISGTGTFTNANDPLASVSGLSLGENIFLWTIDNGPCPQGITTDLVSVFVYNLNAPAANAGPDQQLCTPNTSTVLAANSPQFPATGSWTLINGTATFSDASSPNSGVSGLSVGINTFRWTINNGPCVPASSFDDVVVTVFDQNAPVANAGSDQNLCTPASSTVLAGNTPLFPASGLWTLISGTGSISSPSSPNSQVTGLSVGANVFQWTISNGPCGAPSSDQVTIFVFDENQAIANAGSDQILCSPQSSSTLTGNNLIFPASGLWELVSGSGNIANPSSPSTAVSGLAIGVNTFRWTVFNGPCSPATSNDLVSITIYDSNAPVANAGPDQDICTPQSTVTMAANSPVFPATGLWTLVSGTGSITNPSDPATAVTNLGVGINVFQWTINNGPCGAQTTTDQVVINVYSSEAEFANAGPDQNLCTPQTSTLMQANSPVIPAFGFWTLISGTGTLTDPSDPNSEVSDLSIGLNVFQWSISNGPCANSLTSDLVTITVFDGGAPSAEAGPDQGLCTPTSSTFMDAEAAVPPGSGLWTVVEGTGVFVDPTDPFSEVFGLSLGINKFYWTLDYSTCGTQVDSVTIILYDSNLPAADAGDYQFFCSPVDQTNLNGNAVPFPAFGEWSVINGSGDIQDINDANTLVTNLPVGENVFVWTISSGNCLDPALQTDTVSVFIYDQTQGVAFAGDNQFLCTPQTSTNLQANPAGYPALGQWNLVQGSGNFADPTNPLTLVSGLSVGENIFQWTINNGVCPDGVTTDFVSVFVFDQNQAPANAGPDQSLCTPSSSTALNANPLIFPATGSWFVQSGTGVVADINDPQSEITNLSIGENIIRWTIDNGPCSEPTTNTVSIFIFDENAPDANAGEDQELCFPQTSTTLSANDPTYPGYGEWTIIEGSGVFTNPNSPTSDVSGLSTGVNTFQWTLYNGPCDNGITTDLVSVLVFDPTNDFADAGPDQSFCAPNNGVTMAAASPTVPAFGFWTLVEGSGTISNVFDPSAMITGLSIGENIFAWTVYNGPCAQGQTTDIVSIFIYDENQSPANAGPDQNLCTPATSATLSANLPIFPATGFWTIFQGSGSFFNPNDPNTLVQNLGVGVNVFIWTINNGPCNNPITSDAVTINLFDQEAPESDAGEDQELCFPNTSTSLAANAVGGASTAQWQLVSGTGVFADPTNPNTTVSGLSIGINTFAWVIDNGPCGTSTDEISVLVFDPNAPAAEAGQPQEFCTPVSTTFLDADIPTFPGTGTWDVVFGNGTFTDNTDPATEVSGLTIGENIFSWTVYNGPCAAPTVDFVSVFIFDENAPDAQAGSDQEICLPQNAVQMDADPAIFPASGTWSVLQGTGIILDVNDPNTFITNLSSGINEFMWTIDNSPCPDGVSSDNVVVLVFSEDAPLANAGPDQDVCTPQTTVVMNALDPTVPQTGTWTLFNGSGTISDINDPDAIISGLSVGVNTFTWTIYNGPCNNAMSVDFVNINVFDQTAPDANAGEDQEICLPINSATLQGNNPIAPASGFWTLVQGSGTIANVNSPITSVSNLGVGVNIFQWTINNGPCPDAITSDTVTILVFQEDSPLADAGPDQEICTPQSTVIMNALDPTPPQSGTWALVSGNGTISDVSDPNAIISGLTVGINIFSWTIYNGPCENASSIDLVSIVVYDATAPAADAGDDQELCWPEDSTIMTATPPVNPATGVWSVIEGAGVFDDPTSPTSGVSGLSEGNNVFQWTVSNGPCPGSVTSDTVAILVFRDDAPLADAGPDQEICTPESCVTLNAAEPVDPQSGEWSIISGSGTIDDPTNPNAEICGLTVGETVLQWTIYNGPCQNASSLDVMVISIFDANAPLADAGNDQELCSPDLSTQMTAATPLFPATGTWALVAGAGDISDVNDPSASISNLEIGINTFSWTVYNGPCDEESIDIVSITVYDPDSPDADAGEDQYFCTPDGDTVLEANSPIFPAIGTWEILTGSGDIADVNDPNSALNNPGLGINILVWEIYNGPCANGFTSDTLFIYVNDINVAQADAGEDQFYCGEVASLQLEGSVTIGNTATGLWTIIEGGGDIVDTGNEVTVVNNVPVGINTYVWTVDNLECGISSDTMTVFVYDPLHEIADAGIGAIICEDEFLPFNLNGNDPIAPSSSYWYILEGPGELSDFNITDPEVTTLGEITTPLQGVTTVFVYTIDNGVCGTTADTVAFILDDCLTIDIPDAFSPNADNINDTWFIPNLYKYPNNSLKIFNRWGNLIYEAAPYDGTWNGTNNQSALFGDELPVSTYYYILDLGDGSEPFAGFVFLQR